MQSINLQRGMSSYGMLLTVVVIGFFVMCLFKIAPIYVDNMFVKEALQTLGQANNLQELDKRSLNSKLSSTFDLNGVRGVPTKSVKMSKRNNNWVINVDYEVRVQLLANIDVVVWFENQLDTANPDECCKKLIADVKE